MRRCRRPRDVGICRSGPESVATRCGSFLNPSVGLCCTVQGIVESTWWLFQNALSQIFHSRAASHTKVSFRLSSYSLVLPFAVRSRVGKPFVTPPSCTPSVVSCGDYSSHVFKQNSLHVRLFERLVSAFKARYRYFLPVSFQEGERRRPLSSLRKIWTRVRVLDSPQEKVLHRSKKKDKVLCIGHFKKTYRTYADL